jgi:S-adenosylmethionine:tRNA-ribosyltransferase-isomerase (queuine synthetase)
MASNVIVILTTEKGPINENKHMLYTTIGTGDALIFNNGQAVKAKWSKKDRESEVRFVDAKGKDVPLSRGLTWIAVVDKSTEVEY